MAPHISISFRQYSWLVSLKWPLSLLLSYLLLASPNSSAISSHSDRWLYYNYADWPLASLHFWLTFCLCIHKCFHLNHITIINKCLWHPQQRSGQASRRGNHWRNVGNRCYLYIALLSTERLTRFREKKVKRARFYIVSALCRLRSCWYWQFADRFADNELTIGHFDDGK